MGKPHTLVAAAVIGATVLLIPVGIAGYGAVLAGRQAAVAELERLTSDLQRRATGTRTQIDAALVALNAEAVQNPSVSPCTPAHMQNMSRLSAGASYLQGLGYIQNDTLICSSLSKVPQAVALGAADHIRPDGSKSWNAVTLPNIPGIQFNITATQAYAAITAPDLAVDILDADARISLAQIGIGPGTLFRARGVFKPRWVDRYQGDAITFSDGDYLVDMHPSDDGEVAALAAMPLAQIDEYVAQELRERVPMGALIGVLLAGAVGWTARRQLAAEARPSATPHGHDASHTDQIVQNA